MSSERRVVIVGGGFTGLAAAYELAKAGGVSITLAESGPELGGLAAGFPLLGTTIEKGYHHLFKTDTYIQDLIKELGLSQKLLWRDSSVAVRLGGRIYPFMSPMDLLRFKPCSLAGRLRLGLVMLYLQKRKNWLHMTRQTAYGWILRACGPEVMRTFWTPLLKGKFDRYYDSVSMAWLWARIHVRANSRAGAGGKEQLGYIQGGFAEISRKLEMELTRSGARILKGKAVERIEAQPFKRAILAGGESLPFDACLFTGPSGALARILPPDPALNGYAEKLRSIQYLSAVCLVFVSEQSIADQYWLNIHEEGAPFLVFLQHTRLLEPSLYQNKHVYYIGSYQPEDSPLLALTDEALIVKWFGYLKQIYPLFDPGKVSERHLFRLKNAQHIVDTAYKEKIPDYRTPVPGLFLANFSQIFPEDRGTNYAAREGKKVAKMIVEELRAVGRA